MMLDWLYLSGGVCKSRRWNIWNRKSLTLLDGFITPKVINFTSSFDRAL